MKFERFVLLILFAVIIIGAFIYDYKVSKLEERLAETQPADTVQVIVQFHDTTYVGRADSIFETTDTTILADTVHIYHWPHLIDNTEQPLFLLRVGVDTRASKFTYEYKYKPLTLNLMFYDKYDLKKGFKVTSIPPIGNINVDWGSYSPIKEKRFELNGGFGYTRNLGPFLLSGFSWKKNTLGLFLVEGGWGIYYQRAFLSF